ncbi:MAG: VIT1/CCC1 transporter family protein [Candidatus Hadarchaeum sp.]|uniref:VIT1/CCC1 transporter family protein n=1 Tax=Candidatus Hadarchaeum sp. TaxID=2883567 RepID=UPI003D150F0C
MNSHPLSTEIKNSLVAAQKEEINGLHIYKRLSSSARDQRTKEILSRMADDELRHYNFWKDHTGLEVKPNGPLVWFYLFVSRIFGITFGLKLMEKSEERAQENYEKLSKIIPEAEEILRDEEDHEKQLIDSIHEERLEYVSSMVLGLNDALVELTGALAGFSFAFENSRYVAVAGLITGIAASVSMATSEYLSTKAEDSSKRPGKAALYTGVAYLATVMLLIAPFLLFQETLLSLGLTILFAVFIIFVFTYYVSVARGFPFLRRFAEMAAISLGVAALTFLIGVGVRIFLGIEI